MFRLLILLLCEPPPHTHTPHTHYTHTHTHTTHTLHTHTHTHTHTPGSVELRAVVRGEVSQAIVRVSAGKNKNRLVINSVLVELPNREFLRL